MVNPMSGPHDINENKSGIRGIKPTRQADRPTEDDIAREKLGPRGVPGAPDPARMTPQEEKNIPRSGKFDGHTA